MGFEFTINDDENDKIVIDAIPFLPEVVSTTS